MNAVKNASQISDLEFKIWNLTRQLYEAERDKKEQCDIKYATICKAIMDATEIIEGLIGIIEEIESKRELEND